MDEAAAQGAARKRESSKDNRFAKPESLDYLAATWQLAGQFLSTPRRRAKENVLTQPLLNF